MRTVINSSTALLSAAKSPRKYWTRAQAIKRIRSSPATVYNWAKAGYVKTIRRDGKILFSIEQIIKHAKAKGIEVKRPYCKAKQARRVLKTGKTTLATVECQDRQILMEAAQILRGFFRTALDL